MILLYLLPKNWLSRMTGALVHLRWPNPIKDYAIRAFAKRYQINLSEAEFDVSHYPAIGDFFVRRLKSGLRPVGLGPYVHPADAVITQMGSTEQMIQAKDQSFSLSEFITESFSASKYAGGSFATYYLCPTDYHRVHSPLTGVIRRIVHVPGELWPVNAWSTQRIQSLFCRNERVIVEIETEIGSALAVFVGATNVGQISISAWPELRTNLSTDRIGTNRVKDLISPVEKGQELGCFHMGSTVVMILDARMTSELKSLGREIQLGPTRVAADL
jgi:phosphatidylserine decarboxylase